jgi:hypothetical protein
MTDAGAGFLPYISIQYCTYNKVCRTLCIYSTYDTVQCIYIHMHVPHCCTVHTVYWMYTYPMCVPVAAL